MSSSLDTKSIILALRDTYSISKSTELQAYSVVTDGVEVTSSSIVSQDYEDLRIATDPKHYLAIPSFLPHNSWGALVKNKIKISWKNRCKHTMDNNQLCNVVEGMCREGIFYPDLTDPKAVVSIKSTDIPIPEGTTRMLIPFNDYTTLIPLTASLIPSLKMGDTRLACQGAWSYYNISINRQGLYINRKFREKKDIIESNDNIYRVDRYTLNITYDNKLLLEIDIPPPEFGSLIIKN